MKRRRRQHINPTKRCRSKDDSSDEFDDLYVDMSLWTTPNSSSEPTGKRLTRSAAAASTGTPLAYLPIKDSQHIDDARKVVKVLISIDFGTQATKAFFMTFRKCDKEIPRLLNNKSITQRIERVTWRGGICECPTQLAIIDNDGKENILWGRDVDNALNNKQITESDILRGMKASVFGVNRNEATSYHMERLSSRMQRLSSKSGYMAGAQTWDPYRMWVTFLRKAFSHVLTKIKAARGSDLPWPSPNPPQDYLLTFKFSDYPDCVVEVAFPIPAGLAVEHCQLALDAAEEAGLPNCYLVAEPASVAAIVAQEDYEQQPDAMESRPTLFVDNGCGTVDLSMTSISESDEGLGSYEGSICLQEIIPGVMRWCGGDINNKEFRKLVTKELDLEQITREINSSNIATLPYTHETLLDYLEREFEDKKKTFGGMEKISLPLPHGALPRPKNKNFKLLNDALVIEAHTMREIFSHTLKDVVALIDSQLAAFHNTLPSSERSTHPVRRIVLAGGGNENEYVSQFLTDRYQHGRHDANGPHLPPKFLVEVIRPASSSKALMMTVKGALLLLLDRPFVGKRVARRAYCFSWDEYPVDGRKYEEGQIKYNEMVCTKLARDAANFMLNIGDVIEGKITKSFRGTRGLWLDENHNDGWEIEETLWYTDDLHSCKDGTWVRSNKHDFGEAGYVRLKLTPEEAELFEVKTAECGKQYRVLEYEVVMSIEHCTTSFKFTIPCSGSFKVDRGSITKITKLDCAHSFATYTTSNANRECSRISPLDNRA